MALEKWDFTPESGNVDTYAYCWAKQQIIWEERKADGSKHGNTN